jgi:putative transposase
MLRTAFLWSAQRRVSRTATVSFEGNEYEVDASLVGRTVELRYRPEDLFAIEVWHAGHQAGWAEPRRIARHVHRSAPPPPAAPPASTGIDYLGAVLAAEETESTSPIAYRAVPGAPTTGEPFR